MNFAYARHRKAVAISLPAASSRQASAILAWAVCAALASSILMLKTVLFLTE